MKRWVKESSWYSAGSVSMNGRGDAEPGDTGAAHARRLHEHLVLVREDQRVGLDVEAVGRLAPLAGHRVGAEQPDILDQLRAPQPLERRVDLAALDRPAERPAGAVLAALGGVEVAVQRLERLLLEPHRVDARPGAQPRHDRDAPVDRRLDDHPRAHEAGLVQTAGDLLEGRLRGQQLLEPDPAALARTRPAR